MQCIRRSPKSRAARLARYKSSLDRIADFLAQTNPEVERKKIERAMVLLFGLPPTIDVTALSSEEAEEYLARGLLISTQPMPNDSFHNS